METTTQNNCLLKVNGWDDQKQAVEKTFDLDPVRKLLEFYTFDEISQVLRDIHHDYSRLNILNHTEHGESIRNDLPDLLFALKHLADTFSDIHKKGIFNKITD